MSKRIKKILLINPPNTIPKTSIRRIATPLGLLYLGGTLEPAGYKVEILDSTMEGYYNTEVDGDLLTYGLSLEETKERIIKSNPDIIGISSMFSARQKNADRICKTIKEIDPAIPVVIGGIHPSLFSEECLESPYIDYVIMGEGEFRLPKLLNAINEGKEQFDFDGVGYKRNKRIIINPMIERISDLDTISLPARHLIDMESYINICVPYAPFPRKERVGQLLTSRGCVNRCNFCSTVNYWGRKFRTRSVDNIIKEIDELVNKYGVEEIQFIDDNMTIDRERAMELFRRMKDYNLAWCTPHGLMAATLDKEMLELMAESGAYQITLAIESGSPRVLKEVIHKLVPPKERVKELVQIAHNNDIDVHGLFIVGLPGETMEDVMMTLNYPFEVGFDSVAFFIANPIPGSDLYEECKKKGYLIENAQADFKTAEINIPSNSPDFIMDNVELVELVERKTKEFNEFSKQKNSKKWDRKFKTFLNRHGDMANLILGRVT